MGMTEKEAREELLGTYPEDQITDEMVEAMMQLPDDYDEYDKELSIEMTQMDPDWNEFP